MNPKAAQQAQAYFRTRVLTATPEQLQMMLYDGAVRFAEQARIALEKKDFSNSHTMLTRTQKIVTELSASLRHNEAPDLCARLASLYAFIHRKLVDANLRRDVEPINEALQILKYQRETWALLMSELAQQKAATAAMRIDIPAPSTRMEAAISFQG